MKGIVVVDAALAQQAAGLHPDLEVVEAVARRGVDEAGAGVVGDVLAVEQRHVELIAAAEAAQRMIGRGDASCRVDVADAIEVFDLGLCEDIGRELVGEDVLLARPAPNCLRAPWSPRRGRRRSCDEKLIARLPGMVHGVVVQMTTEALRSCERCC